MPTEYPGRCPRCCSTLMTNGRRVWCTFVGSQEGRGPIVEPACAYGIDVPVPVPERRMTVFHAPGRSEIES